jgi:hypothetical protein
LIDQTGTTLSYGAPEVSGDIALTIMGTDPSGNAISDVPATLIFHVRSASSQNWIPLSNENIDVIINGADPSPSHPFGYYGTPAMADALEDLGQNFASTLNVSETPPHIHSQAASLPWGGIYDIQKDWDTPHCGHRDGMTIDLSLSNLTLKERQKLSAATQRSGLGFFYVPESPSNPRTNHWHATLIQRY